VPVSALPTGNIDRVTTTVWLTKFCRAVHKTRAAIEGYKISDVSEAHLSMPCSSAPNCDNRMTTSFIRYVTMTAGPAQLLCNPRRFPSDDLWFTAAFRNRKIPRDRRMRQSRAAGLHGRVLSIARYALPFSIPHETFWCLRQTKGCSSSSRLQQATS
jgi:hypothetical protein